MFAYFSFVSKNRDPTIFIFFDVGKTSGCRHRDLCSACCSSLFPAYSTSSPFNVFLFCVSLDGSSSKSSLTMRRRALCFYFGVWATTSVIFRENPLFFIIFVSFNHLQTFRFIIFRQDLPLCLLSLPHLRLDCGSYSIQAPLELLLSFPAR